ncbi:hypothetical protein [Peribacillus asahii]|uniref:phage head spike fiber domain-containing protein n=1 Tax=Peribacillus asahii TaxID=228899 RepID=UPI00382C4295
MTIGELKQSRKKIKKNILPPFNEWNPTGNVNKSTLTINGYEGSCYSSGLQHGIRLDLPLSYAGKTLSFSIERLKGNGAEAGVYLLLSNNAWSYHVVTKTGKKENIQVPKDIKRIMVMICGNYSDDYVYFKNAQLEEGPKATEFKEYIEINAKNAVNKREIIGKNIVPDSDVEKVDNIYSAYTVDIDELRKYINRKMSISFDVKKRDAGTCYIDAYLRDMIGNIAIGGTNSGIYEVNSEWKRISYTFTLGENINNISSIAIAVRSNQYVSGNTVNEYVVVKNVQLEVGEVSTEYESYKTQINKKVEKGLEFNGVNEYIYKNRASFDEFEIDFVKHAHMRQYDTLMSLGAQVNTQPFYWLRADADKNIIFQATRKDNVLANVTIDTKLEFGERKTVRVKHNRDKIDTFLNGKFSGSLIGEFYPINESDNKTLSVMTYNLSSVHMLNGTLYSFKAWKNGKLVIYYDFENRPNHKTIVIDHSGNGNDGAIKNKKTPSLLQKKVAKKSFEKYPFTFSRESIEYLNGIKYGLNQPRIVNDGILIQQGITNIIYPKHNGEVLGTEVWGKDTAEVVFEQNSKEVSPLFGQYVTKWSKTTKSGTGNCYINGPTKIDNSVISKKWTFSCYLKRADGKPVTEVGYAYVYANSVATGNRITTNSGPTYIERYTDGWYRVVREVTVLEDSKAVLVGFSALDGETDWYIDGWQLEADNCATSYTVTSRPMEKLDIPISLDGQGGSIEVDVDFKRGDVSQPRYIFDSNDSRWLMYFNTGGLNAYLNGVGRIIAIPIEKIPDGRRKITLKWTSATSELFIDGVLAGSGIHNGASNTSKIYLGRRQSDEEFVNGMFHSFVVKDRNGKITYKF